MASMELKAIVSTAIGRLAYDIIKPKQETAMLSFIGGCDVFVSLPTGYSKSLSYATLPATFDPLRKTSKSIVLVVSPLIALMKHQVANLLAKGLSVGCITQESSDSEKAMACSIS